MPVQQVKPPRDVQKKRKQTLTAADEPESKVNRTEGAEADATPGVCVSCFCSTCAHCILHTQSRMIGPLGGAAIICQSLVFLA